MTQTHHTPTTARLAIQCMAPCGNIGTWLWTLEVNGNRKAQSPVFADTVDFYKWAKENGWEEYQPEGEQYTCYLKPWRRFGGVK